MPATTFAWRPVCCLATKMIGTDAMSILSSVIRKDGSVAEVVVVNSLGHEMLDAAALQAVKRWTFQPDGGDGVLEAREVNLPVRFVLGT